MKPYLQLLTNWRIALLMALAIVCATSKPANLKEAKEFYERAVAAGHPRDEAFEAVVK